MVQIDPSGRPQPRQHRLIRMGPRMQPVPRPAHPEQGSGIGMLPGRFEPACIGHETSRAPRRRRFRRIVSVIGIVRSLRLVRVKEEPRMIDQEQVNLQGSAWLLACQSVSAWHATLFRHAQMTERCISHSIVPPGCRTCLAVSIRGGPWSAGIKVGTSERVYFGFSSLISFFSRSFKSLSISLSSSCFPASSLAPKPCTSLTSGLADGRKP